MPRTGRPKAELILSADEREQLTRYARRATSAQALALRCKIVLACADGHDNKSVAEDLRFDDADVNSMLVPTYEAVSVVHHSLRKGTR